MNFITKRDLVETAEFAWTTRVRGSRRLRCGCGGSLTCGSLGGGGRGSIFEILGTLGTGSFFVIDVTDEAVTSKKYILCVLHQESCVLSCSRFSVFCE